jgi:hypothetical protein
LPNGTTQVAALGYTFFGTNSAKREKIVGPKKALTNPPRKTKINGIQNRFSSVILHDHRPSQ